MNIFVLDKDPELAAIYQCDKHVVKMILESAQLLCTAQHVLGPNPNITNLYKSTHINHPCAIWARQCCGNYDWLTLHAIALLEEYTYRYNKKHKCEQLIYDLEQFYPPALHPSYEMTPFVQAMSDQYKGPNVVEAYRRYYLGEKMGFAKWTKREPPEWVQKANVMI